METLLKRGVIVRRDIEQVYEGLFMSATTSLENWIENLFGSCPFRVGEFEL